MFKKVFFLALFAVFLSVSMLLHAKNQMLSQNVLLTEENTNSQESNSGEAFYLWTTSSKKIA